VSPNPAVVATTILELRKATKKYAGVPAIDGVDFALRTGEIHAIVGENGAGKSTLTKVMAGVVSLTSGQMLVEGQPVNPRTPNEARTNTGNGMPYLAPAWALSSIGTSTIRLPSRMVPMACFQLMPPAIRPEASM